MSFVPAVTTTTKTTTTTTTKTMGECCCNNTNWRFDVKPWWDNMERGAHIWCITYMHLKFNRCSSQYTYTTFNHCYPAATIQYITTPSMAPIKWNRKTDGQPNKQLFVPFCCSTRKMLFFFQSRKSSSFFSHSVFSVIFFSLILVLEFLTWKWHRIVFTVLFHFYYYCQCRISIDFFPSSNFDSLFRVWMKKSDQIICEVFSRFWYEAYNLKVMYECKLVEFHE